MPNHHAHRNSLLMIIIILCTLTVIWTNYIFSQSIITDINNNLLENEYKKIWGKENYMILQEIQKREIIWYIETIKKEQPELINEILKKDDELRNKYKILNKEIIDDLKKDTFILWSTWALVSIISFSDMECPFCIEQNKKWTIKTAMENNIEKVNYMYKNFPLPTHKNAQIEAEAAKCVEKIAGWEKYLEYIDAIFNVTKWGWEWYKIEDLPKLAAELMVDENQFNICLWEYETKEVVKKEFIQWRMLWIEAIPSNLIINNETWEYVIISEETSLDDIEDIIVDISK